MSEKWIENAEDLVLFSNQGQGAEAIRLLEIGPVNRTIVDENQAYGLLVLRMAARYFRKINLPLVNPDKPGEYLPDRYKYLDDDCDSIEAYQQTMVGETNSRIQFMKVAIEQAQGILRNAKNAMGHLFGQ